MSRPTTGGSVGFVAAGLQFFPLCYHPLGHADEEDRPHCWNIFSMERLRRKTSQVVFQVVRGQNSNTALASQGNRQAELQLGASTLPASLLIFQLNCLLARAKECIKRHKSTA